MLTKIIVILGFAGLLSSCATSEQATLYAIQDLKRRVDQEEQKAKLPKAWGNSWVKHWENQYTRMRKYSNDVDIDTEAVIYAIEQERIKRGLPRIKGALNSNPVGEKRR